MFRTKAEFCSFTDGLVESAIGGDGRNEAIDAYVANFGSCVAVLEAGGLICQTGEASGAEVGSG